MELCKGGNLASAVKDRGPLPAELAVPMFLDVLSALEYAHSLPISAVTRRGALNVTGVVHRDLKPANIFLTSGTEADSTSDARAKVGDFGLSKAFEVAGLSGLTRTGTAAGTPEFMPRQQLLDYKYASPAVDVWAAAASLYYAISGHCPRDFPAGRDKWHVVWTTEPVPLAQRGIPVPDKLARVLDVALADGEDDLPYATVAELREAITTVTR
jgi:serine/threonine protein kinase